MRAGNESAAGTSSIPAHLLDRDVSSYFSSDRSLSDTIETNVETPPSSNNAANNKAKRIAKNTKRGKNDGDGGRS